MLIIGDDDYVLSLYAICPSALWTFLVQRLINASSPSSFAAPPAVRIWPEQ